MNLRIGHGFDVHRFEAQSRPDATVRLGGVDLAHSHALLAHSDGDVLVHALCDALLGALALGDIGRHFPDSDPAYRGANSLTLLARVRDLVHAAGYELINADTTIIAQAPRIAPFVDEMRRRLAEALQVAPASISVKATTTEGLGYTGRKEGIAAQAVVLLGTRA